MTENVIFPKDYTQLLVPFQKRFHDPIVRRYVEIFNANRNTYESEIRQNYEKNLENCSKHTFFLNAVLNPFILNKINNFELICIDLFFQHKQELGVNHTFDFLLAELDEDKLISLIFGEIKTSGLRDKPKLDDLEKYRKSDNILNRIKEIISAIHSKIKINFNEVSFEFVLVVENKNLSNVVNSLQQTGLPYIIWSIGFLQKDKLKYQIAFHENNPRDIIGERILQSGINLRHRSDELVNYFRINTLNFHPVFDFTPALDVTFLLKIIYEECRQNLNQIIMDTELRDLIIEIGGGGYCDFTTTLDWLVTKIKQKFIEIGLAKENDKNIALRTTGINYNEFLQNYSLRRAIQDEYGIKMFEQAISDIKPIRVFKDIGDFFKKEGKK